MPTKPTKRRLWKYQVLKAVAEYGPIVTRALHRHFPERHVESLRPVCTELRDQGLMTCRRVNRKNGISNEWSITELGRAKLLEGPGMQLAPAKPRPKRSDRPASLLRTVKSPTKRSSVPVQPYALLDEHDRPWEPGKWVHPYRRGRAA